MHDNVRNTNLVYEYWMCKRNPCAGKSIILLLYIVVNELE